MAEVASAEVAVRPTFVGFRRGVMQEASRAASDADTGFRRGTARTGDAAGKQVGEGFSSAASKSIQRGMAVVGGIVAASVGVAAAGVAGLVASAVDRGWDRLTGIENAQAKMRGLGHDAASVDTIMANALAAVKGTSYGLDEAATIAAGAVAAGIAPGERLESVLSSITNAAAAAGIPLADMGNIYNEIAAKGAAYNDTLGQIEGRGLPIYQKLQEQLGLTREEVEALAADGKISFDQFEQAMTAAGGTVADELGGTATGSIANFNTALGRLGAGLLQGAFPYIAPAFQSLTDTVDKLGPVLQPVADQLGKMAGEGLQALATWLAQVDFTNLTASLSSLGQTAGGVFSILFNGDFSGGMFGLTEDSAIVDSLFRIREAFVSLGSQMPEVGAQLSGAAVSGVEILSNVLSFLADHMGTILGLLPVIIAGFIAWRGATNGVLAANRLLTAAQLFALPVQTANNVMRVAAARAELAVARANAASTASTTTSTAAENANFLTRARATAATLAQRAATLASTAATKAAAIAQWAMNAAMSANPIMLIILAIAALVAGLIWFFTQTELGQEIWANVTAFFVSAWENVVAFFSTAWDAIVAWFQGALDWILEMFMTWHPLGIIISNWDAISAWFAGFWDGVVLAFQTAIAWLVDLFLNWTPLGQIIQNWDAISAWFAGFWDGVVLAFQTAIAWLVDLFLNWTPLGQIIQNWDAIVSYFQYIWGMIVFTVTNYVLQVQAMIANVTNAISQTWSNIWNGISNFFVNIWNNIVSAVQSFGSTFQSIFAGIAGFVSSAFSGVVDAVRGPLNGVIGLVNNAIAALNGISVTIPSWVPAVGGQTWGLSLPSIPQLASGGLVPATDGGILANIGEGRYDEVVLPLSPSVLSQLRGDDRPTEVQKPITLNISVSMSDRATPNDVARAIFSEFSYAAGGLT